MSVKIPALTIEQSHGKDNTRQITILWHLQYTRDYTSFLNIVYWNGGSTVISSPTNKQVFTTNKIPNPEWDTGGRYTKSKDIYTYKKTITRIFIIYWKENLKQPYKIASDIKLINSFKQVGKTINIIKWTSSRTT